MRGDLVLVAVWEAYEGEIYTLEFETNGHGTWPQREAASRQEIYDEFFADYYKWAQGNGETKDFETFKTNLMTKLAAYENIYLRNGELGHYPDENGDTTYFLNVPENFEKWGDFFLVFDKAMLAVNKQQSFYGDNYAVMVRWYQFLSWSSTGKGYYEGWLPEMYKALQLPQEIPSSYQGGQILTLPVMTSKVGRDFYGWYDNPEFTGEPVTVVNHEIVGEGLTLYAKFVEANPVTSVTIDNKFAEIKRFETFQLEWTINPSDANIQQVKFESSNPAVATVDDKGFITAIANGKTTITITTKSASDVTYIFSIPAPSSLLIKYLLKLEYPSFFNSSKPSK